MKKKYAKRSKGKRKWARKSHRVRGYWGKRWGKKVFIRGHLRRNRPKKRKW